MPQLTTALDDFQQARRQAGLQVMLAQFTGQSVDLLSYENVVRQLHLVGAAGRARQDIPLDRIVGSVGRMTDFTRTFLPLQEGDRQRWASVKTYADRSQAGWPPIEVYQIGANYFVLDGHHRVSIARQMGWGEIEAYVTEVRTRAPLPPDAQPEDVIVMAEYADFLEQTELDRQRPDCDLRVSAAGQSARLLEQIGLHQFVSSQAQAAEVSRPAAAASWYDTVYLPVRAVMRQQDLLRGFPGRTEADLYLWVVQHRAALEREAGWEVRPQVAMADLARRFQPAASRRNWLAADGGGQPATGQWRREKLADRYTDRLFGDVLVAVSGTPIGWQALEQALVVARQERGRVHGLHVGPAAAELAPEFNARCQAAGIAGSLSGTDGTVAQELCERARLMDLVVFHLAHPPGGVLASGVRQVIQHSPRPLLAARGPVRAFRHALVAFDGSPKAREALFAAVYLAEAWRTELTVLAVRAGPAAETTQALDYARAYAEMHEVPARLLERPGPPGEAIPAAAVELDCDLIVIGGYTHAPVMQWLIGSTLEAVLRGSDRPVLICR